MMDLIKENICRLCLKFGGDTFSDFSDLSSKDKLKVVLPELNVNQPSDFVICSKCRKSLLESYQQLKLVSESDRFIRKEKNYLKIDRKVNLNRIVNTRDSRNTIERICRICLKSAGSRYTGLNKADTDKYFSRILEPCLSKIDRDLTLNPVICLHCHNTFRDMYNFKSKCLDVENKIVQYCKTTSNKEIDLNKVLNFTNGRSVEQIGGGGGGGDDIMTQGDDELQKVSNQSNSHSNEFNKKRPLSEKCEDVVPSKKHKPVDSESKGEKDNVSPKPKDSKLEDSPLPYFYFCSNLIYDPIDTEEIEKWLLKVDELKKRTNISKILTWEEWRKKLVQVFPDRKSYYYFLRKIVNRKKKQTETYVDYYNEKVKILDTINVTGENAVSCLIGGVTDIVVGCVARAESQNHKSDKDTVKHAEDAKLREESNERTLSRKNKLKELILKNSSSTKSQKKSEMVIILSQVQIRPPNKHTTTATVPKQNDETKINRDISSATSQKANTIKSSVTPQSDKKSISDAAAQTQSKGKSVARPPSSGDTSSARSQSKESTSSRVESKGGRDTTKDKTQAKNEEEAKEVISHLFVKPQVPSGRRATSNARPQSDANNRGTSASTTKLQGHKEGTSTRDTSSVRRNETSNKGISAATTHERQEVILTEVGSSIVPQEQREDSYFNRGIADSRLQEQEEDIYRGRYGDRPQEQREESYFNRGISDSRLQEQEEDIYRGRYGDRPQEQREESYFNRGISDWRLQEQEEGAYRGRYSDEPQEEREINYINRDTSGTRWPDQREESYYTRGIRSPNEESNISNVRYQEQEEGTYISRGTSSIRPLDNRERSYIERDIPSVRSHQIEGDNIRDNVRLLEQDKGSDLNRHMLQGGVNKETPSIRVQEDREHHYVNRGTTDRHEEIERSHFSRDLMFGRLQDQVTRGISSVTPEEIIKTMHWDNKTTQNIGSQGKRAAGYVRPLEDGKIEGIPLNKDILDAKSPEQVEGGNINMDTTSTNPEDEWDSNYRDRGISSAKPQEWDDRNITKGISRNRQEGDEREAEYFNRGVSGRSQVLIEGDNTGRNTSNVSHEDIMDRSYYSI
ncbi:hypothetical protein NQ314_015010, partial [Rhamnusium bicolor]